MTTTLEEHLCVRIQGVTYDTKTGIEIASRSYPMDGMIKHTYAAITYHDVFLTEILYKTPISGKFFIYAVGGKDTYCRKKLKSGNFTSGCKITPLSDDAAVDWMDKLEMTNRILGMNTVSDDQDSEGGTI